MIKFLLQPKKIRKRRNRRLRVIRYLKVNRVILHRIVIRSERRRRTRKSPRNQERKRSKIITNQFEMFFMNLINRVDSYEEGEIESEHETLNPMVSITKIDPKEIPDVSNKFLMREKDNDESSYNDDRRDRGFGWSKRQIPQNSSGKICKGRGNFRFRRDSRSRSRSTTPKHWRQAQSRLVKFSELEKIQKDKKEKDTRKDEEIKRRAEERRRRHDALARGDGKKSFFELSQAVPEPIIVANVKTFEKSGSVDLNALDYEESDGEKEIRMEKNGKSKVEEKLRGKSRSRSRSLKRSSRSKSNHRSIDRRDRDKDRNRFQPLRNRFDNRRANDNRRDERRNSRDRYRRSRSKSKDR